MPTNITCDVPMSCFLKPHHRVYHGSLAGPLTKHAAQRHSSMLARASYSKQEQTQENVVVRAGVAVLTEALRLAGVGRSTTDQASENSPQPEAELGEGDVAGLIKLLKQDFEERAYFVTGDICGAIYEPDCYFADPTVSFTGLERWRRNLQLLVPFLEEPRIELYELHQLPSAPGEPVRLKASWRLSCYLRLPWKPQVDIEGATDYELNGRANKICRHIESWSVSGAEAISQIFRTSDRSFN